MVALQELKEAQTALPAFPGMARSVAATRGSVAATWLPRGSHTGGQKAKK